jgi:hypothetical protein
MMQPTMSRSPIAAIVPAWLLSVAIVISAAAFNVAQAQSGPKRDRAIALACGKELKKQCSGVPVQANNMLECLQRGQEKLSERCVPWRTTSRACVIGTQRSVAQGLSRAVAMFSDA